MPARQPRGKAMALLDVVMENPHKLQQSHYLIHLHIMLPKLNHAVNRIHPSGLPWSDRILVECETLRNVDPCPLAVRSIPSSS
jgi:hypothetical protein